MFPEKKPPGFNVTDQISSEEEFEEPEGEAVEEADIAAENEEEPEAEASGAAEQKQAEPLQSSTTPAQVRISFWWPILFSFF